MEEIKFNKNSEDTEEGDEDKPENSYTLLIRFLLCS